MRKPDFGMNPIFITLVAGEKRTWDTGGAEFHCRKIVGGNQIKVSFDKADDFIPVAEREGFKIPHEKCVLFNDSAIDVIIQCYQPTHAGIYLAPPEQGELDVFGNVTTTGQPLTTNGGNITPVGSSYYNHNGLGSGVTIDILAAVDNTNGAIIRTAQMVLKGVGTTTPNHLSIGPAYAVMCNADLKTTLLQRDIYDEAGNDIRIYMDAADYVAASCTYDIL